MTHKYNLRKYTGFSSRLICPKCEAKNVFSVYVDIEGLILSTDVGRCNREDKCGYHYTPKQYFHDNPTSKDNKPYPSTPQQRQVNIPPKINKPLNTVPKEYLIRSIGYDSNFVQFLCSLFDRYTLSSPIVSTIMKNYYLGYSKGKGVIFWQVDRCNRIRTGKIMLYDSSTGKRIKNNTGAIDWVHSKLKKRKLLSNDWELSQCFFGEHLLNKRPNADVCIVESEKSAIIASGAMPDSIWLATGGKQNFKADKCQVLRGRNITLFPDLGAFDEWTKKAESISIEIGSKIRVSTVLENIATDTDRYNGLDIADYLIRELTQNKPLKTMSTPFTQEEKDLHLLIKDNPNISTLVSSLGLVSLVTNQPLRMSI